MIEAAVRHMHQPIQKSKFIPLQRPMMQDQTPATKNHPASQAFSAGQPPVFSAI